MAGDGVGVVILNRGDRDAHKDDISEETWGGGEWALSTERSSEQQHLSRSEHT